jgi:hypothetical protein
MLEMPFYHPVIEEGLHTAPAQLEYETGHETERCAGKRQQSRVSTASQRIPAGLPGLPGEMPPR